MSEASSIPADAGVPEPVAPQVPADNGKLSFDERIRTDPDFALQTVKNFQTKLNQAQTRLKPLEQLENVARGTFGDVAEGVAQIVGLADRAYKIEQNPQWKTAVDRIMAGERVSPTEVAQADEYQTPEERKIQALEGQLQAVRSQVESQDTRMSQSELTNRLSGFFNSDIGQALTQEERAEMVGEIQSQFKQWSATESGRGVLRNLQADTVETVVVSKLHKNGKLAAVYERIRQGKDQHRLGAATDSPSALPPGTATSAREFKNAAEALRHAAKEYMTPESRQRIGW